MWKPIREHYFYYDGWLLTGEVIRNVSYGAGGSAVATDLIVRRYLWGPDLAGQRNGRFEQAAGGIGGLLAVTVLSNGLEKTYLPLTDGLGNVRGLVDAQTGAIASEFRYDPYGVPRAVSGDVAEACPFRFQTKYWDAEIGLYYFGYRYYNPSSCKWLCRDPKGEAGGINLTAYCDNDPVNGHDPFGLTNDLGDFGWGIYSESVGNFDDVRALRNALLDFEVPLPQKTTGAPAFNSSEINAVWPMDGYDVTSGAQAGAALGAIGRLTALQFGGELLRAKYGSLDAGTERALRQGLSVANDVWGAWNEYAGITGNVGPETGGIPTLLNLRDLSPAEIAALYDARARAFMAANPVIGLQLPGFDPVDILSFTVAARAVMGVAAIGSVSQNFANDGVLIGEYMPRVRAAGKVSGLRVWPARNWNRWVEEGVEVQKNRRWLLDQILAGRDIYSLGKTYGFKRGDYFREEVDLLVERGFRRRFERMIDVPGFGEVKLYKWIQP